MVVGNGTTNHPQRGEPGWRPQIPHAEREHTPPALAQWLVELAAKCKTHNDLGNRRAAFGASELTDGLAGKT
jgi:hypothetical protein